MKLADDACCVVRCPLLRMPPRVEVSDEWREEQQRKQERYQRRERLAELITKDQLASSENSEKSA